MPDLSLKIRKLRLLRELTQEYIAENLGVNVRTYRGIETGKISPTIKQSAIIAQVLQCTFEELIHFNPDTCQFEATNPQDIQDFANELISTVLSDGGISVTEKIRFVNILYSLTYRK